jgi:hypothetical protein
MRRLDLLRSQSIKEVKDKDMNPRGLSRPTRLVLALLLLSALVAAPQSAARAALNAPVNADFEQGRNVGWQETSTSGSPIVWNAGQYGPPAHGGSWIAFLGGLNSETSTLSQTLTILPDTKMAFWYRILSVYSCGTSSGRVLFNSTVVKTWDLCSANHTDDWVLDTVDLSQFAGQTGTLQFISQTAPTNYSAWLIDDIVFYDVFLDVPMSDPFAPFIKAFYDAGITSGCTTNPSQFCPGGTVTRGQMAVFIERALGNFSPSPSPSGMFADLSPSDPFTPFIEEFYNAGITSGCTTSPLRYCPDTPVTRGQMAVFIERALGNFSPPAPAGIFTDVPPSHPFAAFIEEFYNAGITSGCTTSPLRYCPDTPVTRGQMAVFIVRAFGLPMP